MAKENRNFVGRATRALVELGVTQFLDVGTGIPTSPNLHETAQAIAPDAKVVYVDNDPVVLAHARALMISTDEGTTAYVDADIREPEQILATPELVRVLDLGQPVGLMLIAVLMLVADEDDPWGKVAALRDALPSGSYLALTHPTQDFDAAAMTTVTAAATQGGMTFVPGHATTSCASSTAGNSSTPAWCPCCRGDRTPRRPTRTRRTTGRASPASPEQAQLPDASQHRPTPLDTADARRRQQATGMARGRVGASALGRVPRTDVLAQGGPAALVGAGAQQAQPVQRRTPRPDRIRWEPQPPRRPTGTSTTNAMTLGRPGPR
jgi:S-adenosyl methyltransferase